MTVMDGLTVEILSEPSEPEEKAVLAALVAFNQQAAGPSNALPFLLTLRDPETAEVVGGMTGYSGYDWLFIQLFVVPESHRGQGMGSRLMAMAETEARRRGCVGIWLDTFSFQARPFYEKLGFICFGQIGDHPRGGARYFMQKRLD